MSHTFAAASTTESIGGTSLGIALARIRSVAAIALGFASAVVWGAADFLGGLKSRKLQLLTVLFVSQAAGLLGVTVWAAARGGGPPAEVIPWGISNGVAGTVGLAAFYRGLSVGAMGVVAPISASAAAIPVAVGVIGGERPAALQIAGIAMAVVGVALASYEPPAEGRRARTSTGVTLALLAALGFGVFFVGLDEGSNHDLVWTLVIGRITSTSILTVAALALRPKLTMSRGDLGAVLAVGILDVSANALFAAGTTLGLVSVVAVLGSLYPVTTIVLARFVLGERLHRTQRGGAVVALVGVALISAG
jgi:drug/metabolite transporter (DMT)-like permease